MHGKGVGTDPWLLWGSTQTIEASAAVPFVAMPQMVNIDYHHPTTWRFFLFVQALSTAGAPPASTVSVDFDLLLGVGRSNSRIERFCRFDLLATDFNSSLPGQFCTAVNTPDPGLVNAPARDRRVDVIPAQSIQVACRVTPGPSPGTTFFVTASAYFAPATHVRPEWFAGHFGSELGGR